MKHSCLLFNNSIQGINSEWETKMVLLGRKFREAHIEPFCKKYNLSYVSYPCLWFIDMATDKIIDVDWFGSYEFYTAIPGSLIDKKYIDANNPLIQDSSFVEELKDLYKVLRNEIRREVYFGEYVGCYEQLAR